MSVSSLPSHAVDAPHVKPVSRRSFAFWMRWLHIYLSMLGLVALLFFSVTGITLNHPDWFLGYAELSRSETGQLEAAWLAPDTDVDKLAIVEFLRQQHGIHGALAEFNVDELQCMVTFKGPGYSADTFVDRETGKYDLTLVELGWVAVINDLHKGRDSGAAWKWLIDVIAILCCVLSITGLVLLFYIKRRRVSGSVVGILGGAALLVIYWIWVP
ncbi:MAG: PepSY-associated TM helix domain-containing protein [Planctomycetales bacterium]|nr:PepSY-associated TM helix domain-containing protein [Planctomycetales bacterium]